jgi:prolyl oligopeptidase PreP (S9A serine peptidase family)
MSKAKMIIPTLIAVVAFSALASASASAATAGWMVGGTLLSGSEALATTAAVDENGKLLASGITIECKGSTLNGVAPEIKSPNTGSATSLIFTQCQSKTESCTITPEELKTVPLNVEATLEGALAVVATFTPKTKTTFATIEYKGEDCALEGLDAVTGKAKVLAPTGQDERTLQLINAITTEASGELKDGSSPATLTGSALLKLASGKPWSFL